MTKINIKSTVEELVNTFLIAGKTSLELRKKGLIKKIKTDNTPVSNGDLEVNKIVSEKIRQLTPHVPIISEETHEHKDLNDLSDFWLIDPIDGTRSLYNGYKTYGIQLCYFINKKPVYSLIYLPTIKKNISAILNSGVKINGKKFKGKRTFNNVMVDNYPEPNFECKKVMKLCKINNYFEAGSFAYKSMLIALNKASLMFKKVNFFAWDVFPQLLINKELGNFTFDLKGNEFVAIKKLSYRNGLIVSKSKKNIKKIVQLYK